MKNDIKKAITILQEINNKYTGTEADFNNSIKKFCSIHADLIIFDLENNNFSPWDYERNIARKIVADMQNIKSMSDLKNFLALPELALFNHS